MSGWGKMGQAAGIPDAWHATAIIGDPPEHRNYRPGDFVHWPQIAQSARINSFVTIDAGLERPTRVGERVFLLTKSHVGHDAIVGDDCEVATGAVIGGHAELGPRVKIGLNAVVLPFRKIGAGARIGAGAVVTRDVPPGEVWSGVPARRMYAANDPRIDVQPPRDPGKPSR